MSLHASETLSREDQNILRTASIIGNNFSQVILYGILSPKMRTQMFSSLHSLVRTQWIIERVSLTAGVSTDFSFVHPFFYQTLYDLTPAGDKAVLHYAVASFIEESHYHSPAHYAQLGRHFGLAKDCRPKALEYFVRAASHSFNAGPAGYEDGLSLLSQARIFADSALDYGTLLGLVIYRTQRLSSARKILATTAPRIPPQSSSPPSYWSLWSPSRSNKVASFPATRQLAAQDPGTASADRFLQLLAEMEEDLERLYGEMVLRNCVGVVTEWQRPYLVRWKTATELELSAPIAPRYGSNMSQDQSEGSFTSWMSNLVVGASRGDSEGGGDDTHSNAPPTIPAISGKSGFSSDGDTSIAVSLPYSLRTDIRPSISATKGYSRSI